jgi:hypothetical protein
MNPKKQKPLITFHRRTYDNYGYWHTRLVILKAPTVKSIGELISDCDRPGWYQTPEIAARVKRGYTAMQSNGVEYVVDTVYATRVQIQWLHYNPTDHTTAEQRYCRAHVSLRENPGDIDQDYKFYRSLLPRFARVENYHQFERPDVILSALDTMGARELHEYRSGDLFDWVFYAPNAQPLQVAS